MIYPLNDDLLFYVTFNCQELEQYVSKFDMMLKMKITVIKHVFLLLSLISNSTTNNGWGKGNLIVSIFS